MNPDGTNVTRLSPTGTSYNTLNAKYSWDGRRGRVASKQALRHLTRYSTSAYFNVSNPAGTMIDIPNTDSSDMNPAFSPDGKWIVFDRVTDTTFGANKSRICKMKLDGTSFTYLTDGTCMDEVPSFSPDGKYVVFKREPCRRELGHLSHKRRRHQLGSANEHFTTM